MDEFDLNSDSNLYNLTAALYCTVCYWLVFIQTVAFRCSVIVSFNFLHLEFFKARFDAVHSLSLEKNFKIVSEARL